MALFKILNNFNSKGQLPATYVQGYCYFDVNTGKFYIDTTNTAAGRMAVNAGMADKLRTARTITFAGDATGDTSFDGSSDKTVNLTVNTASQLRENYTINGTVFNGTKNITTASWGAARNIKISDGTNTSSGVSVGTATSGEYILKLPTKIKATIDGNAATSNKLAAAKTISLSGDATGSTTFDGSKNVDIAVTVQDDSHNHNYIGKANYIAYPTGGILNTKSSPVTGAIQITLPVKWTNVMMKFTVSIYNHTNNTSVDYIISGYNYSGNKQWVSYTAICEGKAGIATSNLPVRFCANGEYPCITIGEINTAWSYPIVAIHDITYGYQGNYTDLVKPWTIEFVTTLPTVQQTISNTHVGYKSIASSCLGNSATASKWATARTITFNTGATGSVTFDGSKNVDCTLTIADDSHLHDETYVRRDGATPMSGVLRFTTNSWPGDIQGRNAAGQLRYELYSNSSSGANASVILRVHTNEDGSAFKTYTFGTDGNLTAEKFTGALAGNATSANKWATARTITLTTGATGSVTFDGSSNQNLAVTVVGDQHTHSNAQITSLDGSKITSGTIPLARLPQGALERMVVVADDTARFKLTTATVQLGDVVKVTSTNKMYFVKDQTKLTTEDGYEVFAAGTAASVRWANIQNVPTLNFSGDVTGSIALSGESSTGKNVAITVQEAGQLKNDFKINGTVFKGNQNITTSTWGTARNVTIKDHNNSHAGTATSMGAATTDYILHLPSTITATLSGNASTASKLATGRTITLTGNATGSTTFDGSGPVEIAVDVQDDSHEHTRIQEKVASGTTTAVNCTSANGYITSYYNIIKSATGLFPVSDNANSIMTISRHAGNYLSQLGFSSNGSIYYRSANGSALTDTLAWKKLAFTTDNVASADKLKTARKIKLAGEVTGETSFNGTGDVTIQATMTDGKYLNLAGGAMTGSISANMGGRSGTAIGFYPGDANGTGIAIGAGGRTIIGSGESAQNLRTAIGTTAADEAGEAMYVTSDGTVTVFTNCQTIANRKAFTFGTDGNLTAEKFTGALTGNATSANKWATARTITVAGDATGSVKFDGSADKTLTLDVASAAKVDNALTVKVTNAAGAVTTTTFDGSGAKTVNIDMASLMPLTILPDKTLTLTTEWQDLGISGTNIPNTGSYIIQILVNDGGTSGTLNNYREYYTGVMSWFSEKTNSTDSDEIILHKAGHASNNRYIYLRTIRTSGNYLKLQIAANITATAASVLKVRVRQLI